jgi:DNA-binding NarL/FixJ family response regulator
MIKVLVADDHVIVRNGLKQLFGAMGDLVVAGEAENGVQVLQALQQGEFDLLLLDLNMPGISGVELIEAIRAQYPALPILVLSMRNEAYVAKRVIQAGIAGYVTKGGSETMLINAVRKVAAGERFIDSVIAEQLMFEKNTTGSVASIDCLSGRELQIMKLFAQGMSVNEISKELGVSQTTISTYKTRLMKKMDFQSNSELVLYAGEHGLIDEKMV